MIKESRPLRQLSNRECTIKRYKRLRELLDALPRLRYRLGL